MAAARDQGYKEVEAMARESEEVAARDQESKKEAEVVGASK